MNEFSWDLRYPGATTFEGMIIWSARPTRGPRAPIGTYKVRLRAGDYSNTYDFNIQMDPNLEGVTEADLKEQFDLANQIIAKESAANEAVIEIRGLKEKLGSESSTESLVGKLTEIEEALYQTKNQSPQDPLNFPIRLNNRLSSLRRSVETGEAKPTDAAYKVFEEQSAELDELLKRLEELKKSMN